MSQVVEHFLQAELSLISYARLTVGEPNQTELIKIGLSPSRAVDFAANWSIVDQYDEPSTGLSATVFEEVTSGRRYLAVRGTQLSGVNHTANGMLALEFPSDINPPDQRDGRDKVKSPVADYRLKNFEEAAHFCVRIGRRTSMRYEMNDNPNQHDLVGQSENGNNDKWRLAL